MRRIIKNILFDMFVVALLCGGIVFIRQNYNIERVFEQYTEASNIRLPEIPETEPEEIFARRAENPAPDLNPEEIIEEEPAAARSYVKRKLRREVTIGAVGDVSLASNYVKPYLYSFNYYYDNNGREYFFENVRGIFEQFDISVANLECALTDNDNPAIRRPQPYSYKGKESYAEILKLGGINIVNLANNHTFDYGQPGFDDTLAALEAAGIGYFGYDMILIKEVNGLRVGFIGAWGSGYISDARLQGFKAQLDYLDEQGADLKIVSFHWGNNDEKIQNSNQAYLGRFLIDNGADLILGHHPHVLQGIELYNGRYIVYSLGNFIFDGNIVSDIEHRATIIFEIKYVFEGDKLAMSEINLIPALASSERFRNNFQPALAEGDMRDYIINKIESRSPENPE